MTDRMIYEYIDYEHGIAVDIKLSDYQPTDREDGFCRFRLEITADNMKQTFYEDFLMDVKLTDETIEVRLDPLGEFVSKYVIPKFEEWLDPENIYNLIRKACLYYGSIDDNKILSPVANLYMRLFIIKVKNER